MPMDGCFFTPICGGVEYAMDTAWYEVILKRVAIWIKIKYI